MGKRPLQLQQSRHPARSIAQWARPDMPTPYRMHQGIVRAWMRDNMRQRKRRPCVPPMHVHGSRQPVALWAPHCRMLQELTESRHRRFHAALHAPDRAPHTSISRSACTRGSEAVLKSGRGCRAWTPHRASRAQGALGDSAQFKFLIWRSGFDSQRGSGPAAGTPALRFAPETCMRTACKQRQCVKWPDLARKRPPPLPGAFPL